MILLSQEQCFEEEYGVLTFWPIGFLRIHVFRLMGQSWINNAPAAGLFLSQDRPAKVMWMPDQFSSAA